MIDGIAAAIEQARLGADEGGIPIGAAIVVDGEVVGRGRNRRVQQDSMVLHAEMDALENAGRIGAAALHSATMFTTLSPCDMCSGAILLYGIERVVVGEHQTFRGPEDYLRGRGVEVEVLNRLDCVALMRDFVTAKPELWFEDIGR